MTPLPNFVVIGAMRCGTTSLHAYFGQHPEVFMSPEKETDYFSLGDLSDEELPRSRPPGAAATFAQYRAMFRGAGAAKAVGEASPSYLYYAQRSAARLRERLPEARLVCVLRDPVDRAYSHFGLNRKFGIEPEADFERAIAAEEASGPALEPWMRYGYLRASRYRASLEEFAKRFPPQQLRVVLFEEFRGDPAGTMRRLYEYVGVDAGFVPDVSIRYNRSGEPRGTLVRELIRRAPRLRRFALRWLPAGVGSRAADLVLQSPSPLSVAVRRRLRARFVDDIRALEALLGRDLSAWTSD